MAASFNRFSNISEEEVDNRINDAIPEKKKAATKYGMMIFNWLVAINCFCSVDQRRRVRRNRIVF